jgi:hypothetical protein
MRTSGGGVRREGHERTAGILTEPGVAWPEPPRVMRESGRSRNPRGFRLRCLSGRSFQRPPEPHPSTPWEAQEALRALRSGSEAGRSLLLEEWIAPAPASIPRAVRARQDPCPLPQNRTVRTAQGALRNTRSATLPSSR